MNSLWKIYFKVCKHVTQNHTKKTHMLYQTKEQKLHMSVAQANKSLRLFTTALEQSTTVGVGVGVGAGLGRVEQLMPQKVEFVKPEGDDPSMLYITVFPAEFLIDLPACFEYTDTVYSGD